MFNPLARLRDSCRLESETPCSLGLLGTRLFGGNKVNIASIYHYHLISSLGNSQFFIGSWQSVHKFDLVLVMIALQLHPALLGVMD